MLSSSTSTKSMGIPGASAAESASLALPVGWMSDSLFEDPAWIQVSDQTLIQRAYQVVLLRQSAALVRKILGLASSVASRQP